MSDTTIEFPVYVDRPMRGLVLRGLHRWADETGYSLTLEKIDRRVLGVRFWVAATGPAATEDSARAALDGLDGSRVRQARWALAYGRAATEQVVTAPPRREYQLIEGREHVLSMWCDDPECEDCTDIGDGVCVEDAQPVNGECSCRQWSCRYSNDLDVLGAFNAHRRQVQRPGER